MLSARVQSAEARTVTAGRTAPGLASSPRCGLPVRGAHEYVQRLLNGGLSGRSPACSAERSIRPRGLDVAAPLRKVLAPRCPSLPARVHVIHHRVAHDTVLPGPWAAGPAVHETNMAAISSRTRHARTAASSQRAASGGDRPGRQPWRAAVSRPRLPGLRGRSRSTFSGPYRRSATVWACRWQPPGSPAAAATGAGSCRPQAVRMVVDRRAGRVGRPLAQVLVGEQGREVCRSCAGCSSPHVSKPLLMPVTSAANRSFPPAPAEREVPDLVRVGVHGRQTGKRYPCGAPGGTRPPRLGPADLSRGGRAHHVLRGFRSYPLCASRGGRVGCLVPVVGATVPAT